MPGQSRTRVGRARPWNLSSKARRFAAADAFLVSIPKSGRTWWRVFIDAYRGALGAAGAAFPAVAVTHDRYEHAVASRFWERLTGKYLIPSPQRWAKPIAVLARDPRDVVVSLFFQVTKREGRFAGGLAEMIHDPVFGVHTIIDVMNAWMGEWGAQPRFRLFKYEECRRDPERVFREFLGFIGVAAIDEQAFAASLAFADFDAMRARSAAAGASDPATRPADAGDAESYKVRRGKVGGYVDYLGREDVAFVEGEMRRLDPRYGYAVDAPV